MNDPDDNVSPLDVHRDGNLDDLEEQNQLLEKEQVDHSSNFSMKRLAMGSSLFALLLVLSKNASGWVTASLVQQTKVNHRSLIDNIDNVLPSQEQDGNVALHGRRATEIFVTGSSILKGQANTLYDSCSSIATIKRYILKGEYVIPICPADAGSEKTGSGTDFTHFTFSKSDGKSIDITCPSGDSNTACSITGSALASPIGAECTRDIDCADTGAYCFLNVCSISDGEMYFVDQGAPDGGSGRSAQSPFNDLGTTVKLLQPGDTLIFVGDATNDSYNPSYSFGSINDDHLWHGENTLYLRRIHGEAGRPITITSRNGAVLKGDGNNIIRVIESSYLRFHKLEAQGEVDNIPYETAVALQLVYKNRDDGVISYRVDPSLSVEEIMAIKDLPKLTGVVRPSYTDTRGFYANDSHHLVIEDCHFHHTPGNGLRLAYFEYVDVLDTEVDHCSLKSYSGTMGVTPTYIQDQIENDPVGIYRLRMLRNKVHNNYNEIWSWNPTKTFIHPEIDEGKGISCERCNTWANGGRALFANNLVYSNGYSGLNCNDSSNLDFIGNTAYMNTYTDSVFAVEKTGRKGFASRGGITFNDGTSHRMFNNIAVCDTDVEPICLGAFRGAEVEASNNMQFGIGSKELRLDNTKDFSYINIATNQFNNVDPNFKDPEALNFRLKYNSPALGQADPSWASIANLDLYGVPRDLVAPDLGAIEAR